MTETPLGIVIVGAGGHGREVFALISACNDQIRRYDVLGFLDDGQPDEARLARLGTRWIGRTNDIGRVGGRYVLGVGVGTTRRRLHAALSASGGMSAPPLIHPNTWIGPDVEIGPGAVIFAGVTITTNVRIGRHVHLNRGATVGHDVVLGDFVTAAPLAAISGDVMVEDDVELGTGAALLPGITIGRGAVIGAAALVNRDVPPGVVAFGVPATPRWQRPDS